MNLLRKSLSILVLNALSLSCIMLLTTLSGIATAESTFDVEAVKAKYCVRGLCLPNLT